MAERKLCCRLDDQLMAQMDESAQLNFGGNRTDFVKAAITYYLHDESACGRQIPDSVRDTVEFLLHVVLQTPDLSKERDLIRKEVIRLWTMVRSMQ